MYLIVIDQDNFKGICYRSKTTLDVITLDTMGTIGTQFGLSWKKLGPVYLLWFALIMAIGF